MSNIPKYMTRDLLRTKDTLIKNSPCEEYKEVKVSEKCGTYITYLNEKEESGGSSYDNDLISPHNTYDVHEVIRGNNIWARDKDGKLKLTSPKIMTIGLLQKGDILYRENAEYGFNKRLEFDRPGTASHHIVCHNNSGYKFSENLTKNNEHLNVTKVVRGDSEWVRNGQGQLALIEHNIPKVMTTEKLKKGDKLFRNGNPYCPPEVTFECIKSGNIFHSDGHFLLEFMNNGDGDLVINKVQRGDHIWTRNKNGKLELEDYKAFTIPNCSPPVDSWGYNASAKNAVQPDSTITFKDCIISNNGKPDVFEPVPGEPNKVILNNGPMDTQTSIHGHPKKILDRHGITAYANDGLVVNKQHFIEENKMKTLMKLTWTTTKFFLAWLKTPTQLVGTAIFLYVLWSNKESLTAVLNFVRGIDLDGGIQSVKDFCTHPLTITSSGAAGALGARYLLVNGFKKSATWLAKKKVAIDKKAEEIANS